MSIKLSNSDCLLFLPTLPNNSVDLLLVDLPYGITNRNDWDQSIIPFDKLWPEYTRICKKDATFIFTAVQPFTSQLVLSKPEWFKYEWIWNKSKVTGVLNAKKQPLRNHEEVLIFYREQPVYNPQGLTECYKELRDEGESLNYGKKNPKDYIQDHKDYPRSVLSINSEGSTIHPTQKPVELMAYMIRTYTNPKAIVLDHCMGSGTTGEACIRTGRSFIGCENNNYYYSIAYNRIKRICTEDIEGPLPNAIINISESEKVLTTNSQDNLLNNLQWE